MKLSGMCPEILTINRFRSNPGCRQTINLHFYFQTSLWCLTGFYKGTAKTFEASQIKYENENSI